MIRILGIDPGSQITGYGIIDSEGNHSKHIDNGIIRVEGNDVAEKLRLIYQRISELISDFEPDEVSIEKVFMHKNADSAL
ncbi:MAG: crossover junction endodeoxyribonuclease RuvC, partial [Proteobacteria bacterium]|nr:crossover junction endodeoxyribonuclease RuvC [Pseudomonadota bacterium]